jgi:hypothetical protein
MGRLRLFGELIEAGGAVEGGGGSGGGGGGHQIARVVRTSGNYLTTSTSFVDIDTDNLVINMTTGASWVLLLLLGSISCTSAADAYLDFTIDGNRQGQAKGVQMVQGVYREDVQIAWLAQVEAGAHTFRPQWRVSANSANLRASAADTPLLFAVLELQ